MKFGNSNSPPLRVTRNKGSASVVLPDRRAVAQLTKGNPEQMSLSNFAKLTPSGAKGMAAPDIFGLGIKGTKIE